jgi:hypothetical protein
MFGSAFLKVEEGRTAYDFARNQAVRRILEDLNKASSMTAIDLEPQYVEHLSMVGAFLLKDENDDIPQLNGKLAKMISDLQSVQDLLTQYSGSISNSDSDSD